MIRIKNDKMNQVVSFVREKDGDKVITIVNLGSTLVNTYFKTLYDKGNYRELFTDKSYTLSGNDRFSLAPWSYLVLVKSR